MREAQSRTIDGITITVQQLPAMRAMKLAHRLGKSLGPGLLRGLSGVDLTKGAAAVSSVDVGSLAPAVEAAFDRFSEEDLERLVRELFETATVQLDGRTAPMLPVFDATFQGKTSTVFKAIKFALEVNYQDFFGALLGAVGAGKA